MSLDKEFLISEVKARPALWKKDEKDYKNLALKDVLWEEIGKNCQTSSHFVKKKWKNLLYQYRRELIKVSKSKLISKPNKPELQPKWLYFNQMEFVNDYIKLEVCFEISSNIKKDLSNVNSVSEEDSIGEIPVINNSISPCENPVEYAILESKPQQCFNHSTTSYGESSRISHKRSLNATPNQEQLQEVEPKKHRIMDNESNEQKCVSGPIESSNLHFFKSLISYMELFSPIEQLDVRNKMQQIILDKLSRR